MKTLSFRFPPLDEDSVEKKKRDVEMWRERAQKKPFRVKVSKFPRCRLSYLIHAYAYTRNGKLREHTKSKGSLLAARRRRNSFR
jgi:hypothetical protein